MQNKTKAALERATRKTQDKITINRSAVQQEIEKQGIIEGIIYQIKMLCIIAPCSFVLWGGVLLWK